MALFGNVFFRHCVKSRELSAAAEIPDSGASRRRGNLWYERIHPGLPTTYNSLVAKGQGILFILGSQ